MNSFAGQGWDANLLRDAQAHLERARTIDPSNVVAETFLSQVYQHNQQMMVASTSCVADLGFSYQARSKPHGSKIHPTPMMRKCTSTTLPKLANGSGRKDRTRPTWPNPYDVTARYRVCTAKGANNYSESESEPKSIVGIGSSSSSSPAWAAPGITLVTGVVEVVTGRGNPALLVGNGSGRGWKVVGGM